MLSIISLTMFIVDLSSSLADSGCIMTNSFLWKRTRGNRSISGGWFKFKIIIWSFHLIHARLLAWEFHAQSKARRKKVQRSTRDDDTNIHSSNSRKTV